MKASVKVSGMQRIVSTYARRLKHPAIAAGLNAAAQAVVANARQELDSVTGDDTSRLSSSLKITVHGTDHVSIGTSLDHGRFLEFGKLNRPAQPWLEPAFEVSMPQIRARLRQALATAFALNDRKNS